MKQSNKGKLPECHTCLHSDTKVPKDAKPYTTVRLEIECHFSHSEINKHMKDEKCGKWVSK